MPASRSTFSAILSVLTVLGSRGGGAVAGVLALILMTRSLSAGDVGVVVTVQSAAVLFGLLVTLNLDAAALRALPGAEEKAPGTTAAFMKLARRTVMVWLPIATVAAAAWFFFRMGLHGWALLIAVLTVPAAAALRFAALSARGMGEVLLSSFVYLSLRAMLFALGLGLIVIFLTPSLSFALMALFAGFTLAALLQFGWLLRALPKGHPLNEHADLASWRHTGLVLMVTFLISEGYPNTVLLLSAAVLSDAEIARLAVVLRVALMIGMIPAAVNMALGPKMARHLNLGEMDAASQMARRITRLSTLAVIVSSGLAILLATPLLSIFGTEYAGDGLLLIILLAIPLSSALTGAALLALTVQGANSLILKLSAANIGFLALVIFAASPFGYTAIVIALAVADILWKGSLYVAARRVSPLKPWLPVSLPAR